MTEEELVAILKVRGATERRVVGTSAVRLYYKGMFLCSADPSRRVHLQVLDMVLNKSLEHINFINQWHGIDDDAK